MTDWLRYHPFVMWLRYFRPGRCAYCHHWTLFVLRSEGMHEECWLELT